VKAGPDNLSSDEVNLRNEIDRSFEPSKWILLQYSPAQHFIHPCPSTGINLLELELSSPCPSSSPATLPSMVESPLTSRVLLLTCTSSMGSSHLDLAF
jgi:hypothetical protein